MQTLEKPANGHPRANDADFAEIMRRNALTLDPPVNDPLQAAEPIGKKLRRKRARGVSFEKLLDEIAREESQPKAEDAAFPLPALPPLLRRWVEAVAEDTQTAPEAAAMLALAASSAAIAGKVQILGRDGVANPVNLFVGVLHGGDRCDDVLAAAIAPLRELEFEELQAAKLTQAKERVFKREQQRTLRERERAIEKKQKESGSSDAIDSQFEGIDTGRNELEALELTPLPRRILDDVTPRSLRYQLSQLDRIACFSPRGDIFRQIAGRSTATRERLIDTLEAGHKGREFTFDGPCGKQTPVYSPAITVASLVDASVVSQIAGQRECHARSLLSKFLFVSPESRVGSRRRSQGMESEVVEKYRECIRALAKCASLQFILSGEAIGELTRFEIEVEPQLGPRGSLAPIGEWGKNLVGTVHRIAAILHLWGSNGHVVPQGTVAAAIAIVRWLVPQAAHALAKLGAADDNCTPGERALLRYARQASADDSASEISPREAWQHLRKTFRRTGALRKAFARLVHRGYLRVAREGEEFPKRFALAAMAVELVRAEGQFSSRSKKKKSQEKPMKNQPAEPKHDLTESTQVGESRTSFAGKPERDSNECGQPDDKG